ncbi:uncharacterized protein LOC106463273 [Limulus polyphemus]|uniref:Uncharacterized protein LOC106463273 n=1 Tax=Limulus polyphemus TaxID=6850 RepID=A0ABM1BBM7_LIMPO|nr:uncharacterized protein LOC106463273 [Limulus polyphemus]
MADPWLEREDSRNDEKRLSECHTDERTESISSFDDDFTAVSRLPDSDNYIKSLESRLDKLKCKNRDLSSKDIITSLQAVRHGHVERRCLTDPPVTCSLFSDYESVDIDEEISSSYIEKRIFPAKQALTKEEIQALLEADILAKTTAAMTDEESHVKDSSSPEALR